MPGPVLGIRRALLLKSFKNKAKSEKNILISARHSVDRHDLRTIFQERGSLPKMVKMFERKILIFIQL